jgi:hypothetical protein
MVAKAIRIGNSDSQNSSGQSERAIRWLLFDGYFSASGTSRPTITFWFATGKLSNSFNVSKFAVRRAKVIYNVPYLIGIFCLLLIDFSATVRVYGHLVLIIDLCHKLPPPKGHAIKFYYRFRH